MDIDFTRSVFQVKRFEEVIDRIVFRDFNELQNKTKELNEAIEYYTLQYESIFIKQSKNEKLDLFKFCLLYTSDAADERSSVDLGGRRFIKKKKQKKKDKQNNSKDSHNNQ